MLSDAAASVAPYVVVVGAYGRSGTGVERPGGGRGGSADCGMDATVRVRRCSRPDGRVVGATGAACALIRIASASDVLIEKRPMPARLSPAPAQG
jgi:hypothetical protein